MAGNLIRGSTQIQPQSLTLSLFDPALALPDSYLVNGANFLKRDGSVSFTGNLNLGSNKITGLAAGTALTDAINLGQLQSYINGFSIHFPRLVSFGNIASLSGGSTVDGVTPSVNDEVLLTAQTTGSQNGPWLVQSGAWVRPGYWSSGSVEQEGQYFIIGPDGNAGKNTKWFTTNTSPITVDSTTATFQQDLTATVFNFTSGLVQSGNTVSVARGNGLSLDGSNNLTVLSDPARLLQSTVAGVGIKDGSAGQLLMANSSGNASYQTLSGDATISSAGALAINHTAGSGFVKYTDFVSNEVPGGTPNGSLTTFTLAATPQNGSLELFKNGQLLKPGAGNDYNIVGTTITLVLAPATGEQLLAFYMK
jgi:hypothetical protein